MKDTYLWLSLGENCLSDGILKRHNLKSFSTPYSSGRSNIDYAISLETEKYKRLLNYDLLKYETAYQSKVVRSTYLTTADDIFEHSCSQGFEFTHHDPISSIKDLESYKRKCERIVNINKKTIFLYHHRFSKKSNIQLLKNKLSEFIEIYRKKSIPCVIILFYQIPKLSPTQRTVNLISSNNSVLEFEFQTEAIWEGNNPEIFWAKTDDDLILKMLTLSQQIIN